MPKINWKREHNNYLKNEISINFELKTTCRENKFDAYKSRFQVHLEEEN